MNRKKAKELMPIIQAFAEGKAIDVLNEIRHYGMMMKNQALIMI